MTTTLMLLLASLLVAGSLAERQLDDFEGVDQLDDVSRPYVVLNFLKQARQGYEGKPDAESQAKLQRLNTLIELSDVTKDKCDDSHLQGLEALREESAEYLVEYVEAYCEKQLLKCQGVLAEAMSTIINGLNESDKEVATQLKGAIVDVAQRSFDEGSLSEDLALAVAQTVRQRLTGRTNVEEADFAAAYQSSVGSFCESLVNKLKLSPGLWQVASTPLPPTVLNKFTSMPAGWVSLSRACYELVSEPFDVGHGYATYFTYN